MTKWIVIVALAAASVGCGSGGSGTPGTGGSGAGGGAGGGGACAMSWLHDGNNECADFLSVTRSTKNGFDTLAVTGTSTANLGLAFHINVANGMIAANQDYACDGAYIVLVYDKGSGAADGTQSCTITPTSVGSASEVSTGTFSAVVTAVGSGATETITNGTFSAMPTISN